ncbi:MAG TPA: PaaI family thioesterase [Acidimicrobiales bacterium]
MTAVGTQGAPEDAPSPSASESAVSPGADGAVSRRLPGPAGSSRAKEPASPNDRLAAAVRRVIDATVSPIEWDTITAAAVAVEAVADLLDSDPIGRPRRRRNPSPEQDPMDFFPNSPIIGTSNPIAPPVTLVAVDGADGGMREMRGTVNFGYPYEGPPTCVHGGVIAELFDEVLGATNIIAGNPGMTGTLTVKYRKPTPLLTDLRIEARCLGWSGRKIRTWGAIFAGDVLTAEAEGIFIAVRPEMMLAIAEGNEEVADPDIVAAIKAETSQAISARDAYRAAKAANAARAGGT